MNKSFVDTNLFSAVISIPLTGNTSPGFVALPEKSRERINDL